MHRETFLTLVTRIRPSEGTYRKRIDRVPRRQEVRVAIHELDDVLVVPGVAPAAGGPLLSDDDRAEP